MKLRTELEAARKCSREQLWRGSLTAPIGSFRDSGGLYMPSCRGGEGVGGIIPWHVRSMKNSGFAFSPITEQSSLLLKSNTGEKEGKPPIFPLSKDLQMLRLHSLK